MRYSHCERDSGRCHNTQLFCKNLVHSHNVKRAGAVDRVAVVADQLGDGSCGKELSIRRVAPVQQTLALSQALRTVLQVKRVTKRGKKSARCFTWKDTRAFSASALAAASWLS